MSPVRSISDSYNILFPLYAYYNTLRLIIDLLNYTNTQCLDLYSLLPIKMSSIHGVVPEVAGTPVI